MDDWHEVHVNGYGFPVADLWTAVAEGDARRVTTVLYGAGAVPPALAGAVDDGADLVVEITARPENGLTSTSHYTCRARIK